MQASVRTTRGPGRRRLTAALGLLTALGLAASTGPLRDVTAAERVATLAAEPPQRQSAPAAAPAFRDIPVYEPGAPVEDDSLRVLAVHKRGQPHTPVVAPAEVHMLKEYAAGAGRELAWVLVEERWDLVPALQRGDGDLIVGQDERIRAGMAGQVEFTLPWTLNRQRIVGRRGSQPLSSLADLRDRQIAVKQGSPAYSMLTEYASRHATMDIIRVPESQDVNAMLRKVRVGQYDLAVIESGPLNELLPQYPELNALLDLPGGEKLVWGVRPAAGELRQSVDRFLSREALSRGVAEIRFEDLPRIEERRTLRVITYQSPTNYFLDSSGELRGFEYELIRKFARQRDLRVEMVVAPSQADMIRWLLEGRGDLIAASMPAAGVRNDPRLSASRPYNYAAPLLVGREHDRPLIDARDLEGRRVVVPAGSPHKRLLERYRQRGIGVEVVEARPGQSISDILYRVKVGIYDLTVVDSHKSRALLAAEPGTQVHFPLSEPLPQSWIVRADDSQLLSAVNEFIDAAYRKRDYNILHARYFEHPVQQMPPVDEPGRELLALGGELSPYDDLVRRYADEFGFDWRLIVAQMYQESRFDPSAVSDAGAVGLMQLMPSTASEVGITELYNPDASIRGGVRYLSRLYQQFDDELAFEDRVWFSLAAYNAGLGRLEQARRQAREMGLNPDRWFDNVEKAMMALADTSACRCGQPVVYVREIRARYNNYVRLTRAARYAARDTLEGRRGT